MSPLRRSLFVSCMSSRAFCTVVAIPSTSVDTKVQLFVPSCTIAPILVRPAMALLEKELSSLSSQGLSERTVRTVEDFAHHWGSTRFALASKPSVRLFSESGVSLFAAFPAPSSSCTVAGRSRPADPLHSTPSGTAGECIREECTRLHHPARLARSIAPDRTGAVIRRAGN